MSLTEILVGTAIFMIVGLAAYRIFTKSTQKAVAVQQQTKFSRGQTQFIETFRKQLENTPLLPNAETTAMQLIRPVRCSNVSAPTEVGWSLIPYPGYDTAGIQAMPAFQPFDPNLATINDSVITNPSDYKTIANINDAVTLVYIPQDSEVNYLAVSPNPADNGAPVKTEQTSPNDPVEVDTLKSLRVGDFAIIADATQRDLIRVTDIITGTPFRIRHSYVSSLWNKQMSHNFGGTQNSSLGRPMLYKVKVATYAVDKTSGNLMVDDHIKDDQFTESPSPTFGTAGLAYNWQVVTPNVNRFRIYYVLSDGTETRTPYANVAGADYNSCATSSVADCDCENQLEGPRLRTIRVDIQYDAPSTDASKGSTVAKQTVQQFNPTLLKEDFSQTNMMGCLTSGTLYTTDTSGNPNPDCTNKYCLCSDRPCTSNCYSGGGGHGSGSGSGGGTDPGDYGGGGSG